MKLIEIQKTRIHFEIPEDVYIETLLAEFVKKEDIKGSGMRIQKDGVFGLKWQECNKLNERFVDFLKSKGYRKLTPKQIRFST